MGGLGMGLWSGISGTQREADLYTIIEILP